MILVTKTSDQTRQREHTLSMHVCIYVCIFIKSHIPRNPALSSESFYVTRIDPPKGGSMILVTNRGKGTHSFYACMYVCMYIY